MLGHRLRLWRWGGCFCFFGWNACRPRVVRFCWWLDGLWVCRHAVGCLGRHVFPWSAVVVSCAVVVCGAVAVVLCENWIVDASILFFCVYLHDRIFVFL